jgi:serine/threonine protein phosphatase PrpC
VIVAFLIGAIRMATEVDPDPVFILRALNRRLIGQENAAVTCLALHIAPDGLTTLAGPPPPYRNGWPVAMEGALPLGVFKDAEPSVKSFVLEEQDRLVLISDGILEATDSAGEPFGFERIQSVLSSDVSASAFADAAQTFGQEDDISAISVIRHKMQSFSSCLISISSSSSGD